MPPSLNFHKSVKDNFQLMKISEVEVPGYVLAIFMNKGPKPKERQQLKLVSSSVELRFAALKMIQ